MISGVKNGTADEGVSEATACQINTDGYFRPSMKTVQSRTPIDQNCIDRYVSD